MPSLAVSGSRYISDTKVIKHVEFYIDYLEKCGVVIDTINVGDAKGVDKLVRENEWNMQKLKVFHADWESYGKSAGPKRNKKMLSKSNYLIAFPRHDSKGTISAINIAKDMKMIVKVISECVTNIVTLDGTDIPELKFRYSYFYGLKNRLSFLSNFYPCIIEIDEHIFHSSEQYYMKRKQELFDPDNTVLADKIMNSKNASESKRYGRQVKNFDETIWRRKRCKVMRSVLRSKFYQNEELLDLLLDTDFDILVEASPTDRIWGIGLNISNAKRSKYKEWNGMNLLGKCLMKVRDEFRTDFMY